MPAPKAVTIVFDFFILQHFIKNGLSPRLTPCRAEQNGLILPVTACFAEPPRNPLPPDIFHSAPDLFPDNQPFARSDPTSSALLRRVNSFALLAASLARAASIHLFNICLATDGFLQVAADFFVNRCPPPGRALQSCQVLFWSGLQTADFSLSH